MFIQLPVNAQDESNPPGTILIEDTDEGLIETTFEAESKSAPGASGGTVMSFAERNAAGDGGNKITVSAEIPKKGFYQIWMRWVTGLTTIQNHADNVPVVIFSGNGEFRFKINQKSGNAWAFLGTYELEAGIQPVISFSNDGTQQRANWDAVKLIPVAAMPVVRPAPVLPSGEDDFSVLTRNIISFYLAEAYGTGGADPESVRLAMLEEVRARIAWDLMLESPHEKTGANWLETAHPASHNLRSEAGLLRSMAQAYVGATNYLGMDLRGNPELLAATLRGLENFTKRYNASTKWDVNWWDFEIGVPLNLLPALILLGDSVPEPVKESFIAASDRFNSDPRKFYNNGFPSTGANRLWLCNVAMLRGALARDAALLDVVKDSTLEPLEFVVRDVNSKDKGASDGYYEDGSFIQHGGIPYVAAYGYLLLESYANVAECLNGTPWQLKGPSAENAFQIIEICFDPFVVRGETVQNVVGRSLGSKNYEGNENAANFVVTASRLLPFVNSEQATRIRSLIKKWITEEDEGKLLEIAVAEADAANPRSAAVLREIATDPAVTPLPPRTGFEMFANMDIATHRAGDFAVSLGMNSQRIKNFETIWGANVKGWFQSEGLFLLYTPDIERYRDAYFNLVDPYRFPGITVERFERKIHDGGGASPAVLGGGDFVGGVALDGNGIAAMHVKPAEGSLEARKSWFFFGDQIICLGAGIGAQSENTVETTIENARILADTQKLIVDGKPAEEGTAAWENARWAWLGGSRPGADLGWVFFDGNPALNTLLETRQGSRADTHVKGRDNTPRSMRFATLWFDHGAAKPDGTYAYAVLPGRDPAALEAYAKKLPVEILANTAERQVVRDPASGFTGIVGWQAGEFEKISYDQPVILLIHETSEKVSVAVSDPTMKLTSPVTIRLPISATSVGELDERLKVVSTAPLVLEFDPTGANGQSFQAQFLK